MNKDQVKGRMKVAKGNVKEIAGKAVGNKTQETKGKIDKTIGRAQADYGDLRDQIDGDLDERG